MAQRCFGFWNFVTMVYGKTVGMPFAVWKKLSKGPKSMQWFDVIMFITVHTGDFSLLWHKMFWILKFCCYELLNGIVRHHLPFDLSFHRDPNRCGDLTKENSFRWSIFASAQNVLTFEILLLWKSGMVCCGAICRLRKSFQRDPNRCGDLMKESS